MRYDLLVTGNVVTPEGIVRGGTVAVSDGRIAEVLPAAAELDAASVLDATELLVETASKAPIAEGLQL